MGNRIKIITFLTMFSVIISTIIYSEGGEGIPLINVGEGFFIEALLNKDSIDYNLEPLRELAEEGLVTEASHDKLYPTSYGSGAANLIRGPEKYYLYRDHTYQELAVMVYETDNSILSMFTGENVDLEGLSVTLVVPTKIETMVFNQSFVEIPVPEATVVDNSVITYMEQIGYKSGVIQLSIIPGEFENVVYTFEKGNVSMLVYLGSSSSNIDMDINWTFQVIGMNTTLEGHAEEDAKQLLDLIGVNTTHWDVAVPKYSIETMDRVVPDVDAEISSYDWGKALKEELKFLRNLSVIKELSDNDIEEISSSVGTGLSTLNDIILHHDGTWKSIWKLFQFYSLGIWPTPLVSNFLIPEKVITPIPLEDDRGFPKKWMYLILGIGISVSLAGVVFYFSRLRTKSLMNNANRSRILECISKEPGIYFRKLCRDLDLKQGVMSYHLNILEKHELVKSVQDGNNRRFYLFDERIVPSITLTDLQENIIIMIYNQPGISQSAISRELGRSKTLVNYHIRILKQIGIVTIERVHGITQCYINGMTLEKEAS